MSTLRTPWKLPTQPWVLHATEELGGITDRWIPLQSKPTLHFEARLLGLILLEGVKADAGWLVARDRWDLWLAWNSWWRSSRWLASPLRSQRPTLIHAHYGTVAAFQLSLARTLDVPIIASFYGFDATETRFIEQRRWRRAYSRLFEVAAAIVVEGPRMAERLASLGCPPEKIEVVRLPADSDSLATVQPQLCPGGFRAVLAGRFIEKKGFDTGIRAFARALKGEKQARLLIIGGGELEASYRQIVRDTGIESQVDWGGRLSFGQFMSAVASADLGLYPSRTAKNGDSEGGAPVTLIEAQWLGVPSLVSTHDDLPYVAAPNGSLVLDPVDIPAWSDAIRFLYEDRSERQRMSDSAKLFVRRHHALDKNVQARDALYQRVC